MKSMDALCKKAKWGTLSDEEFSFISQKIKKNTFEDNDEILKLLYIVGHSGAEEHRSFVEKFLFYRSDTLVCRQALKTLCMCWHLTADYLDAIKMYLRGVEWDESDEVRLSSMNIAGEFLRKKIDPELLQLLIQIFEHLGETSDLYESRDYARNFVKSCAYEAIARAMGKDHNEFPENDEIEELIETGQLSFLDLDMVEKARLIVEKK